MKKKINVSALIINLLVPLAVGGLSSLITKDSMSLFEKVAKPPLSPPAWVFPAVWSVLYVLLGISAYLVWKDKPFYHGRALAIYAADLFVNFLWPIIFFNMKAYSFAAVWLFLLIFLTIMLAVEFGRKNKTAGLLQIPYIIWLFIAAYLNIGIARLN